MAEQNEKSNRARRIGVGIVGGLVLLVGIVAIPYPGPGWLIVFAGLGILASEFEWAERVLARVKGKYNEWQKWLKGQPLWFKMMVWALTAIIVILTIYLLNGYGLINDWLNLNQDWIRSPLFAT